MGPPPSSEPETPRADPAGPRGGDEDDGLARLAPLGVERVLAPNPGPLTLTGTNTWLVGRDPAWVIDPGPALEQHLQRVLEQVDRRGGLAGVALTHAHADHAGGAAALITARPAPLAAAAGEADVRLAHGVRFGPLEAFATPGHAPDHMALLMGAVCFTGDAVLGSGSVFIGPGEGALSGYLHALQELGERDSLRVLCPGHGPPVWEPHERLRQYVSHRLERERRLERALGEGMRGEDELLDEVWSEVPEQLRAAARVTLAAHLQRLRELGRLPDGVERPPVPWETP